jgi:hypothetical protein
MRERLPAIQFRNRYSSEWLSGLLWSVLCLVGQRATFESFLRNRAQFWRIGGWVKLDCRRTLDSDPYEHDRYGSNFLESLLEFIGRGNKMVVIFPKSISA